VLRYDDRGVAQSKGDFKTATTVDFASDVESAIAFLKTRKEINKSKIGLIGHSEGGIIAPMVAAKLKEVNFIVLLAGTGIRGDKLLLLQQEAIAKASGTSDEAIQRNREINTKAFEMVFKSASTEALKRDLEKYLKETSVNNPSVNKGGMTDDQFIALQIAQVTSPWMQYFIKYDPAPTLEKVKCPVLAVNGEKDLQVPPKVNLPAIEKALKAGGNKQVTIKEFPGLNHLFQECKTGAPAEYAEIDQTFSPLVLEVIGKWIIEKTK
jgi:pimeloyl-ACP methyl ester carboxylesterase